MIKNIFKSALLLVFMLFIVNTAYSKNISEMTPLSTSPVADDMFLIWDTSTGITKSVTTEVLLFQGIKYPDSTATDQGVTGDSNTVKYYIDDIGSDTATIWLKNDSGSSTTIYNFLTNETIPYNVTLKIDPGAIITIATGITVTFDGRFDAGPDQYFLNCVGTGKIDGGIKIATVYSEWWGSIADDSTDCRDTLQAAITFANAIGGSIVQLFDGTYLVINNVNDSYGLDLKANVTLQGIGATSIIKGQSSTLMGIVVRSNPASSTDNITIKNLMVDKSGTNMGHGLLLGGGDGRLIDNVTVIGSASPDVYAGSMGFSPFDAYLEHITENLIVQNCLIDRSNSYGIDVGYGRNIKIIDNTITNCFRQGIGLEVDDGPAGEYGATFIENAVVSGNILNLTEDSNHLGGTNGPAMVIGGVSGDLSYARNIIISNNTIDGSEQNASYLGGIFVIGGTTTYTENILVEGNTLRNISGTGISAGSVSAKTRKIDIIDNLIVDSNAAGIAADAIGLREVSYCTVKDNIIWGSQHEYMVRESASSDNNYIGHNRGDSGTVGDYLTVGVDTVKNIYPGQWLGDGSSGVARQETVELGDDATHTFSARGKLNRGTYILATDFDDTAQGIITLNSSSQISVIAQSSNTIQVGTTNPDTDGFINVWPASSTTISLKNRLGSTRVFTLFSFTTEE